MQDLNDKVTGGTLTAAEWNEVPSEIQNVIEGTGQVLSGGNLNQLGKGIANYSANGSFYVDSGAANAYVLGVIGSKQAPTAYVDGFEAVFRVGNTNTTSSTVNVAGLGVKNITGTSSGGTLTAGNMVGLRYNSSSGEFDIMVNTGGAIVGLTPSGVVSAFAANTPPSEWLECDGSAVSRTTYASLFSVIGTVFGIGDGSTTFNLPDLRGEFIRGWDNGRGVDSGRVFGSAQADEFESHTHNTPAAETSAPQTGSSTMPATLFGGTFTTNATGGAETRPRNIAMMFCIKI